ncbi:MAG: bifunctional [glutamine synthetase] adenylyltransferase/[glutamine synthetase]-adenylyl-L-tyrosine phosphorylase, partial [Rhizomicrobium sp.]
MTAFDGASPPAPFDRARAERTFASLEAEGFVPSETQRPILAGAFGNSPFLARLALREHAVLKAILDNGAEATLADATALALAAADAETRADAMARLRIAKRRAALAIALADIAGIWPLESVTRALTEFADACVKGAL